MAKYQDNTSRQALHTNRRYLKGNWPVINITNLTWTLPKAIEREEEAQKQREVTTDSAEEGVAGKHASTDRSDTEMDTEAGGEVGTSQLHSRHKKGHMTNIYLMDSDEEALVDFVTDHQLYDKTNEHFKDKARKECLWERFKCSRLGLNFNPVNITNVLKWFKCLQNVFKTYLNPNLWFSRRFQVNIYSVMFKKCFINILYTNIFTEKVN